MKYKAIENHSYRDINQLTTQTTHTSIEAFKKKPKNKMSGVSLDAKQSMKI